MRRTLCLWVLVGGCGPGLPPVGAEGEASGSSGTPGGGVTTEDMGSSSTMMDGPTSGAETVGASTGVKMPGTDSSGSSPTGDDGMTFITPPDGGIGEDCDVFVQDCLRGYKCSAYANDGGSSWNDAKCVPVMEDPAQPGEPCFVEGNGVSGIDNCELGALCWDTDAENMGTCVELCTGSPDAPVCPEGFGCSVYSEGVLNLCFSSCHPLSDPCVDGELCIPNDTGDSRFKCVEDASADEGQVNDACMYANACDPGLYCIGSMNAIECDQQADGCCQPFCDVTKPNVCAGFGQECVPWYEEGTSPPGYETLGICAVPM